MNEIRRAAPVAAVLLALLLPAAGASGAAFTLTSPVGTGTLPVEYTCDGAGDSPALAWANAPAGTAQLALLMTTQPPDGSTKWNWVLYGIPAGTSSLARNTSGIGTAGVGSDGPTLGYQAPCSQGPGPKQYTFTLYALSAAPALPASPSQVTGAVLTQAIAPVTLGSAALTLTYSRDGTGGGGGGTPGQFTIEQTVSDLAQRTTIAFSGVAMMTGNLEAQSFFPPGKVADYTGFQYLRDNDPDSMGHNTSFLTRIANNVIYILNDSQFAQLKTLATSQLAEIDLYGYKRFPLMKAFRRLLDGDVPAGSTGLDLEAVKAASRELYRIDGQISFDRALLYANLLKSLDATQKAYLDAMKGKGWSSWPDVTDAQVKPRMAGLPQGTAVAVMTYASDLFSWYAGSVEADTYFCPERQGTYYGGFYIKDAPAIGHEGYGIDEQLTATAGSALCDADKGYVTEAQAARISSLVDTQRNNLYAGQTSIVSVRTQIATLLRGLMTSTANADTVEAQVLALSETYGDLDGENNYHYATVFAEVHATLSPAQKTSLSVLRKSIMSGTYADGTPFDFSVCTTPYLYSAVINDTSVLQPYVADTDYLFAGGGTGTAPAAAFTFAPASPRAGQAVQFTDTSAGSPASWSWTFGDGGTAAAQNPTHVFAAAGSYTVTLTAANASGSTSTGHTVVVAAAGATPAAAFTFSPAAPRAGQAVQFTDTSSGSPTSWRWTFGDGATATAKSPSHVFAAAGSYTVTLTAANASGSTSTSRAVAVGAAAGTALLFPVVDTGQTACYDATRQAACPQAGAAFAGQDAQHAGAQARYTRSADGLSVRDEVTGLTWQRSPDVNGDGRLSSADKLSWAQAQARPAALNGTAFGGFVDWRLPTVKELYSLIDFSGVDPSGVQGSDTSSFVPFIDDASFAFAYGDAAAGERVIDSQWATSTLYVSRTAGDGAGTLFGVNFADGRIKGYGLTAPGGGAKTFFVLCVRGNPGYGVNDLVDSGDGTVTDRATGLEWSQADSGVGMDWGSALAWVAQRNAERWLGHDDWRLPDAKELQSIVDYTRSPDATHSAALDPAFAATPITNEAGAYDYPAYWTGTTHVNMSPEPGGAAVYVCFGRAMGYMNNAWVDVHGAGAQRSDPKRGNPADFPRGRGPQGDAIRILNFVRLVRDAGVAPPATPVAGFAFSPETPTAGQTVTFTDTSTGEPVAWRWEFGDGDASSVAGPRHVYARSGSYTVRLTVSAPGGESTATRVVSVLPPRPRRFLGQP